MASSVKQSVIQTGSKTLSKVNAIITALNNFPVLLNTNFQDLLNGNGCYTFNFMFDLLRLCGFTEEDIINLFIEIVSEKNGFLNTIEDGVKAILLANFKKLFTCSLTPLIPDSLMDENKGIVLNAKNIDIYGILNKCPYDEKQKIYYFDTKDDLKSVQQSCDFNAFLWYAIHKATGFPVTWDNRVTYYKDFKENENKREEFFGGQGLGKKRKTIFYIKYNEKTLDDKNANGTIRFWIDPKRYRYTLAPTKKDKINRIKDVTENENKNDSTFIQNLKTKSNVVGKDVINVANCAIDAINTGIKINKTIFQFNYDFIYSMKLFESKTLIASIVKAMLSAFKLNFSVQFDKKINSETINDLVSVYVNKVLNEDIYDSDSDDYFQFSNKEIEEMLKKTLTDRLNPLVEGNDSTDFELTFGKDIENIGNANTPEEEDEAIKNALEKITYNVAQTNETTEISVSNNFTGQQWYRMFTIVNLLLTETITQITLQLLSPKVYFLYIINSIVMGEVEETEDWEKVTMKNFIENFSNLMNSAVLQIKDLIIKQIYNVVIREIKSLAVKYALFLTKEKLSDYKLILKNLLELIGGQNVGQYLAAYTALLATYRNIKQMLDDEEVEENLTIDNVNYMDLVPIKDKPTS